MIGDTLDAREERRLFELLGEAVREIYNRGLADIRDPAPPRWLARRPAVSRAGSGPGARRDLPRARPAARA